MLPSWLLPAALPDVTVLSKTTHAPMQDAKMAGFIRANQRRKEEREAQNKQDASERGLKIPIL